METRRTLWIVAAAGIFLLVVVGLAVILYNPSLQQQNNPAMKASHDASSGWIVQATEAPAAETLAGSTFITTDEALTSADTSDNVFDAGENPFGTSSIQTQVVQQGTDPTQNPNEFSPLHTENVTVIADNTTIISHDTTTIDLNALKKAPETSAVTAKNEFTENQLSNARQNQAAHVQAPTPVQITQTVEIKQEAPVVETKKSVASKPSPAKTEVAAAKPVQAKKEPAPKKEAAVAKTTTAKTVTASKDKFWVQVASYTNIDNAKSARMELESNKIQCDIFTINSNGKDFYRVQSGPFTTKSEAEYWGKEIARIDRFSNTKSMIIKNN